MERPAYSTDMTDDQWQLIEPLLPPPKPRGRRRTVNVREILNAILYLLRTGCQWRNLPHDFPPRGTVHSYYWRWGRDGVWERVHDALRDQLRRAQGRDKSPSLAIVDSQSVKSTEKGDRAATTPARK
jgi:putative transposase